jgi:predicted phosphodiesterase
MIKCAIIATIVSVVGASERDSRWVLSSELKGRGYAITPGTLPAQLKGTPTFGPDANGGGLIFDGTATDLVIASRAADVKDQLPQRELTVGSWVSIDVPRRWGGLIGCVRDDGDVENGWVLGYDERHFTMGLSTTGANDGNGKLTYLTAAKQSYEIGRWHHVVATYDGAHCLIYVDGQLSARSAQQVGDILYDYDMPFVLGAYRDPNEHHRLDGRLLEVRLLDRALSADEVQAWYNEQSALSGLERWVDTKFDWLVHPYLTWPTTAAITVSFETTIPVDASIEYWHESGRERKKVSSPSSRQLHHFRLTGLRPGEKYFYRVSAGEWKGQTLVGEVLSFRTAVTPESSFTFVAIGDTQSQADVAKRVSDLAYMHRPNLVLHAGDLVDTGTIKSDWTGHFFPAMQPLIGRVPLMPVLGNHEQDARHYYEYMDLPAPESYYAFTFGDAEFFMIDGNRKLAEGSDQLAWLDGALAASKSKWKFAVLHQPPFTSDSDDYGNTFRTTSQRGDANVQNIVALLEAHAVDICFSGHVHDYERTFPIRDGQVTPYNDGGVVYVTTAGGGGHLEDFDPNNTWFGHKKARYHHLVYVAVHGDYLEFQAISQNGQLFDVFELRKTNGRRERIRAERSRTPSE